MKVFFFFLQKYVYKNKWIHIHIYTYISIQNYSLLALLSYTEAHVRRKERGLGRLTPLLETFPAS